jgi:hypothetical protein
MIQLLWSEDVKNSEIFRRMTANYGDIRMSYSKVYEWVKRFKDGGRVLTRILGGRGLQYVMTSTNL